MAGRGRINRLWRSLTGRLILGVLAIHALLVPLLFIGVFHIIRVSHESQFVDQVRSDSYLFASLAARDFENNSAYLQQLVEESLISGRAHFVQVTDLNGKVLAGIAADQSPHPFKEDFFFGQHGDSMYYISLPITDRQGTPLALLRLGYDEQPAADQIDLVYRRGLYLAIGYVILTLMLGLVLAPQLTRPLQQLRKTSARIASGHTEARLQVDTRLEEVEGLARDLDQMRQELVKQARALEYQAFHDPITGLANRVLLRDRVDQAILACRRNRSIFALFLMDLDRFKELNDTLGHQAGDAVLRQVAARLQSAVRESDTVARLGGDEFALILPLSGEEEAELAARKIHGALRKPFHIEGCTLHLDSSTGIALYPRHGKDFEELLRRADVAMYVAKRGENEFALYQPQFDQRHLDRLMLGEELRQAVEHEDLVLHYQPKLDLKSGDICGVEALVRWQHPERGLIPPDQFIPLAEKTGLIGPLTLWVLREAARQCRAWNSQGRPLHVAVNVSPRSLRDRCFPEKVAAVLAEVDLPPSKLCVELTESAIFTDPVQAREMLEEISAMGANLSIDDFGTGYSSLVQLKQLPVSEIKIDRSFIGGMTENKNDAAIVRATIELARHLGLHVVAEGVEDMNTLQWLANLGCDMIQGYYIGRPLSPEMLTEFLLQHEEQPDRFGLLKGL